MKKIVALSMIPLAIILLIGCTKSQNQVKIPKDAAKMAISFNWEGIAACTHESPEIHVDGIPVGALELRVKLKNLNVPEWNQGGGVVENDGSGIIPPKALDIGYNGPCPPPGERYKYEFSVMALNAEGAILGFGKAVKPFPPKQ